MQDLQLKHLIFMAISSLTVFKVTLALVAGQGTLLVLHYLFPWILVLALYRMPPARSFSGRLMILSSMLILGISILTPAMFLYCVLGAPVVFYVIHRQHHFFIRLVMTPTLEKVILVRQDNR